MFFRLELNLNLNINQVKDAQPITFSFSDADDNLTVEIRRPTEDEQKEGHDKDKIFCSGILETATADSITAAFENLGSNKMPVGYRKPSKEDDWAANYIDADGNIKDKYVVNLQFLPKDFQDFQSNIQVKLRDYIKRTTKILRWRSDIQGHHEPIQSSRGFFWSFDRKHWEAMPHGGSFRISSDEHPPITNEIRSEIERMVADGLDEPLGHALFREAWNQKDKNPRSSLILGIVAIEVGFKQCVGFLLPGAQWLMENMPSPPITKMLSGYLPHLPAVKCFGGKVLPPPKSIIKSLQNGMEMRNKTTHTGSPAPSFDELEELLLSVRDTLYLLDYYCGAEWALDQVREETARSLVPEGESR